MVTHDRVTEAPATSVEIGEYRHYKGGQYRVVGVAAHTETSEQFVVYQSLYGKKELWVRPINIFVSRVKVDGKYVPRFERTDK